MNPAANKDEVLACEFTQRPKSGWWHPVLWLVPVACIGVCFHHVLGPRTHCHPMSPRQICASNLTNIARACLWYAEENKGRLPDSLYMLVDGDQGKYKLKAEQLVCPVGKGRYVYIRGSRNTDDPRKVLACDSLENHDGAGANVAYLDGHVRWVKSTGFIEVFVETRTQEDFTPRGLHHKP